MQLARNAGFEPFDAGELANSRSIEQVGVLLHHVAPISLAAIMDDWLQRFYKLRRADSLSKQRYRSESLGGKTNDKCND